MLSPNSIVVDPNAIERDRSAVYGTFASPSFACFRSVMNRRSSAGTSGVTGVSAKSGLASDPV